MGDTLVACGRYLDSPGGALLGAEGVQRAPLRADDLLWGQQTVYGAQDVPFPSGPLTRAAGAAGDWRPLLLLARATDGAALLAGRSDEDNGNRHRPSLRCGA